MNPAWWIYKRIHLQEYCRQSIQHRIKKCQTIFPLILSFLGTSLLRYMPGRGLEYKRAHGMEPSEFRLWEGSLHPRCREELVFGGCPVHPICFKVIKPKSTHLSPLLARNTSHGLWICKYSSYFFPHYDAIEIYEDVLQEKETLQL